jgi:hypothetical protein
MKQMPEVPWEARVAEELCHEDNETAVPFFLTALRENIRDGQASLRRVMLTQCCSPAVLRGRSCEGS